MVVSIKKQLLLVAVVLCFAFGDTGKLNALSQSAPKTTHHGDRLVFKRGETITLRCGIERINEYEIFWKKGDTLMIGSSFVLVAPEGASVSEDGLTLTKLKAELSDGGDYVCSQSSTPPVNQSFHVKVSYLDSISLNPSTNSLDIREGDQLRLECEGVGYPIPEPMWLFQNKSITHGKLLNRNRELIVDDIKSSQAGYYQCNLDNGSGEKLFASIRVNVIASGSVIQKPDKGKVEALAGDDVKLSCHVDGTGKMKTKWFFQGEEMKGSESSDLTLRDIQPKNAGEYVCKITTSVYDNLEAKFHVTVQHAPKVTCNKHHVYTGEGRSTDIICFVSADPPARIQWRRHNHVLVSNDKISMSSDAHTKKHTLKIRNLKKTDFGPYTLVANNSFGTVLTEITLSGLPRPVEVAPLDDVSINTVLKFSTESFSPVYSFLLNCTEYSSDGKVEEMEITIPAEPSDLSYTQHYTMRCLKVGATYQIMMSAVNDYGQSEWGPQRNFTVKDSPMINSTTQCDFPQDSPPVSQSSGIAASGEPVSMKPNNSGPKKLAHTIAILTIVILVIFFW